MHLLLWIRPLTESKNPLLFLHQHWYWSSCHSCSPRAPLASLKFHPGFSVRSIYFSNTLWFHTDLYESHYNGWEDCLHTPYLHPWIVSCIFSGSLCPSIDQYSRVISPAVRPSLTDFHIINLAFPSDLKFCALHWYLYLIWYA